MLSKLVAVALRGATMLLGIFSVTVIAPFLGIADLGRFALIQSIVAWTAVIALGLPESCSGIISKFRLSTIFDRAKSYVDTSFLIIATVAVVLACPLLILAGPWDWRGDFLTAQQPFALGLGLAFLTVPFALAQAMLNAKGEITRSMIWSLITSLLTVSFMLATIHVLDIAPPDRLLAIVAAYGIAALIARVAMYTVEARRSFNSAIPAKRLSSHRLKFLTKSSVPFLILNIASLAAFQVDRSVSFYFLSPEDTAKLDVAMKVIMAVYALNTVFIAKLWHSVGQPWNSGDGFGARAALRHMVLSTAGFWLGMGAVIVIAIDPIVTAFTRSAVQVNDPWFVITAVVYIAARAVTDAVSIAIFATRNQHKTVATVIAHGLLNIPFSIAGCIAFGLPGIMLAQLLSLLITSGWKFPAIFMQVTKDRT